jgi:predicted enzyme related to lactoylglutathione lyase
MHFEIMAGPGGGAALRDFYASTFGWQYTAMPEDYHLVNYNEGDPGIGGAVIEADAPTVVISVEVEDVAAYLEQVKANGGEVVQDTQVMPGIVTYAVFRDPAGNQIGLVGSEIPPA